MYAVFFVLFLIRRPYLRIHNLHDLLTYDPNPENLFSLIIWTLEKYISHIGNMIDMHNLLTERYGAKITFYCCFNSLFQAHLSMQRACMFSAIRLHTVESDDNERMTGPALAKAIASDVEKGLIPFYVRVCHCCAHKGNI